MPEPVTIKRKILFPFDVDGDSRWARLNYWVKGDPLAHHDNGRRVMADLGTVVRDLHDQARGYQLSPIAPLIEARIARDTATIKRITQSRQEYLKPLRSRRVLSALRTFVNERASFIGDRRHWGLTLPDVVGASTVIPKENAEEGKNRIVVVDWDMAGIVNLPLDAIRIGRSAGRSRDSDPASLEAQTKRHFSYLSSYVQDEETWPVMFKALRITDLGEVFAVVRSLLDGEFDWGENAPTELAGLIGMRVTEPTFLISPSLANMSAALNQVGAHIGRTWRQVTPNSRPLG